MRYTKMLGRIFIATENLKLEQAHIKHPEAVKVQIEIWGNILQAEEGYTPQEAQKIQNVLTAYLGMTA